MSMINKKISSTESVEEVDNQVTTNNNSVSVPLKKKIKQEKLKGKVKIESDGDASAPTPSGVASSAKDMEKRKKRKALDKEKKRGLEKGVSRSKLTDVQSKSNETDVVMAVTSNGLPAFHLRVFNDLASAESCRRELAAESLVTELQKVQKAYEKLENKDLGDVGLKLEAEKHDGLNDCAPSLRYAVRRLIRGVSSSRECARQGFALGLTLLVGTIRSVKVGSLLKLIIESLEISSSMKGEEEKCCLLGRLFAYGALVRSGRLNEEWKFDKETPYIKDFTSGIITLAAKKRYLSEPAVFVLLDLIEQLPGEIVSNHVLGSPGLHEWFEQAADVGNPDALLLALRIREKISVDSLAFGKLLPSPFNSNTMFSADHLSSLVNCLKESTFCQPRVHSVWHVLVDILLPDKFLQPEDPVSVTNSLKKHKKGRKSSSSEEETAKKIQNFIEIIVEGSLLLSSHDRKHLAFDVLLLLLPRLPATYVPLCLSYKLVRCLMDILSTKGSWLYKVAVQFLKDLSDWVRNDDVKRVAVIVALQKHSDGKFDCVTRMKTVKDLMVEFKTEAGCILFIQSMINVFVDEGNTLEEPSNGKWGIEPSSVNSDQSQTTDDNSEIGSYDDTGAVDATENSDFLKSWVIDSLASIFKNLKLNPEAKFQVEKEILKFLTVQGLFSASLGTEVTSFELHEKFRWPRAATSSSLCKMCIEQLQLLLANAQKVEGSRSLTICHEPNDLGSYFMRFVGTLRSIPSVSLFRSLSEEDEKAFKGLQEMEGSLCREERNCGLSANANKLRALRYLLIQLLLQVLLRPGEFFEAASELIICCKKAFTAASDLPEIAGEDELDDESAPELMDVLVDTLLSLLPQSSAPVRSAIEQVFKHFCHDVTDDGLLRMLRVIKKDLKPARRQDADSEDIDSDDEDFLDIEEDEEIDEAETGETGESEEQSDESEAEIAAGEPTSENPENSDDSDGGMDDDAMFRMDAYLAQIFKEKKNQTGGETAQSQLVLFKLRVLSLLEIYLHENPGKPQVLTVYSNLAQAFVNPQTFESSEQLGQRIWGILQKKIFKAKVFPKDESVDLTTLAALLEKSLKLASKPFKRKKSAANPSKKKQSASWNRYKMISNLAQNSTYWILKIIDAKNFPQSEVQNILDIFQAVLTGYFDSKKSQIKIEFLEEVFRRRPWIGHALFGNLLENCSNAKILFRRNEALDLVTETLRSLAPMNTNDESSKEASRKVLKSHLKKLTHLVEALVSNMPEKQSKRAEVRKFCGRIFQIVMSSKLTKLFLKDLGPEAQTVCESKLGDIFINFRNASDITDKKKDSASQ